MSLKENDKSIEFCLYDAKQEKHCLSDYLGKWVVLYFYPKDNTSGCTKEAIEFSEKKESFDNLDAVIIGISKDSPKSHARFIEKHNLNILLLSDEEHNILETYGAWGKKKNYGKEYFGTIRSTFLIDPNGIVKKVFRNVRVKGHVDMVMDTLKKLKESDNEKQINEETVMNILKDAKEPLKTRQITELLNADNKEVEKIIKKLKKSEKIASPKRCYYTIKEG